MKQIALKRDGVFSVYGGVLVAGDISAYALKIDMGEPTNNFTAMAICQENGNYSTDFTASGNCISCRLLNSMYPKEGFITVRLSISKGTSVLTVKEVTFRVEAANNDSTLAENEQGNIDSILTAVAEIKAAAANTIVEKSDTLSGYGIKNAYTKSETDSKISAAIDSAIGSVLNTEV